MRINFDLYKLSQQSSVTNENVSFSGSQTRKLIDRIMKEKRNKKIHITFDELVKMYEEIGYDVLLKRGSHAVIFINEKLNFPVIIPHGNKYVTPSDIKRFKCMYEGNLEKAKWI